MASAASRRDMREDTGWQWRGTTARRESPQPTAGQPGYGADRLGDRQRARAERGETHYTPGGRVPETVVASASLGVGKNAGGGTDIEPPSCRRNVRAGHDLGLCLESNRSATTWLKGSHHLDTGLVGVGESVGDLRDCSLQHESPTWWPWRPGTCKKSARDEQRSALGGGGGAGGELPRGSPTRPAVGDPWARRDDP